MTTNLLLVPVINDNIYYLDPVLVNRSSITYDEIGIEDTHYYSSHGKKFIPPEEVTLKDIRNVPKYKLFSINHILQKIEDIQTEYNYRVLREPQWTRKTFVSLELPPGVIIYEYRSSYIICYKGLFNKLELDLNPYCYPELEKLEEGSYIPIEYAQDLYNKVNELKSMDKTHYQEHIFFK